MAKFKVGDIVKVVGWDGVSVVVAVATKENGQAYYDVLPCDEDGAFEEITTEAREDELSIA